MLLKAIKQQTAGSSQNYYQQKELYASNIKRLKSCPPQPMHAAKNSFTDSHQSNPNTLRKTEFQFTFTATVCV
jgi:hypothetical protein